MSDHTAHVTVQTDVDEKADKVIDDGLEVFGEKFVPKAEENQQIRVYAHAADGRFLGGVRGNTGYGWLHIWQVWVDETARRQGLGTRLLKAAEIEAVQRGCHSAHLDSLSFPGVQEFYAAQGWLCYGVLERYFAEYDWHSLRKRLVPVDAEAPGGAPA
ncbi:GNAT family N-acetyltransferase [Pacificoceanicola onchidii]|uniref:GNAT family N-acetyltransferase n=1 Tax=Pacificoceanicola onchidii TaxID=2562685 RepID=UPI0010A69D8A|nr:GNAT family N-acetyltransferase [Pacificoceanicola onchidii]